MFPPFESGAPPLHHWYVKLVPVAVTEKLTGPPAHASVTDTGCTVMFGALFTATGRLADTPELQVFFGTTVTLPDEEPKFTAMDVVP